MKGLETQKNNYASASFNKLKALTRYEGFGNGSFAT